VNRPAAFRLKHLGGTSIINAAEQVLIFEAPG
jgi:hypothetical protein